MMIQLNQTWRSIMNKIRLSYDVDEWEHEEASTSEEDEDE
jgi:hypothetical protein